MRICLKDNKNVKWIIITVLVCFFVSAYLKDEEVEILGELLILAGGVFIVLGL